MCSTCSCAFIPEDGAKVSENFPYSVRYVKQSMSPTAWTNGGMGEGTELRRRGQVNYAATAIIIAFLTTDGGVVAVL